MSSLVLRVGYSCCRRKEYIRQVNTCQLLLFFPFIAVFGFVFPQSLCDHVVAAVSLCATFSAILFIFFRYLLLLVGWVCVCVCVFVHLSSTIYGKIICTVLCSGRMFEFAFFFLFLLYFTLRFLRCS